MASTIRHNRARGSHDVDLMSNIVKNCMNLDGQMRGFQNIWEMDKDEILRPETDYRIGGTV